MICPKCQHEQPSGHGECLQCGIVFARYAAFEARRAEAVPPSDATGIESADDDSSFIKTLLLPVPSDVNPLILLGRAILLVLLAIWALKFMSAAIGSNYAGRSVLHLINLPFHEAGHIVFSPFGKFIQTLGGTIGQLVMPIICVGVLLIRTRDAFGAAVALWWLAESFMDIAPYINDARALDLVLLGGVTGKDVIDYHDWEYILRHMGLLRMDHALAMAAQFTGIVLMASALVWAGTNIWIQYRIFRESN